MTLGATPSVQVPVTEETVEEYDLFGGIGGEFQVVDDDDPFTWLAGDRADRRLRHARGRDGHRRGLTSAAQLQKPDFSHEVGASEL